MWSVKWCIVNLKVLYTCRTGAVQKVKCVPIVVSLSSFKSSKANEVWGESFTHWMPLCELHVFLNAYKHMYKCNLQSIHIFHE